MARAAQSVAEEQAESTDLAIMATVNPVAVFTDREQFSSFYRKLKEETDRERQSLDVSTERGRKAIRSLAFRVTKAKTTLDKSGLELTADWRAKIDMVNTARREMTTELDALAKDVRKPLTEWEEAEKARIERCRATIERIKQAAVVTMDDTSETVRVRGGEVWQTEIGEDFGDLADEAKAVKETAVATLQRARERLAQEEAGRAELARLRAEAAEREAREQAEREAQEAAEAKRRYARDVIEHVRQCGLGMIGGKTYPYIILIRELEEKVVATEADFGDMAGEVEKARVETLEHVREAAEQQAERHRRETEERAAAAAREEEARKAREAEEARERERKEAEAKRQREHEAQLAEERRQREEVERIAREEREQREREEAERRAEAARIEAERRRQEEEDRAREADRAHRAQVIGAAAAVLVKLGVTKKLAETVVLAIAAGEVPAVSLRF